MIHYDDLFYGDSGSQSRRDKGQVIRKDPMDERFCIKLTPDGFINTTTTRINFQQDNWFENFLEIQRFLEKTVFSTKVDM